MTITIPGFDQDNQDSKLELRREVEVIEIKIIVGKSVKSILVRHDWLKKAVEAI